MGYANLLEQGLEAPIIIIIIIIIKFLCRSLLLGNNVQSEEEISSENVNGEAHFPVSLPPEGGNYKVEDLRKIVTSCVTIGKSGNGIKYYLTASYPESRLLIELTVQPHSSWKGGGGVLLKQVGKEKTRLASQVNFASPIL